MVTTIVVNQEFTIRDNMLTCKMDRWNSSAIDSPLKSLKQCELCEFILCFLLQNNLSETNWCNQDKSVLFQLPNYFTFFPLHEQE